MCVSHNSSSPNNILERLPTSVAAAPSMAAAKAAPAASAPRESAAPAATPAPKSATAASAATKPPTALIWRGSLQSRRACEQKVTQKAEGTFYMFTAEINVSAHQRVAVPRLESGFLLSQWQCVQRQQHRGRNLNFTTKPSSRLQGNNSADTAAGLCPQNEFHWNNAERMQSILIFISRELKGESPGSHPPFV